PIQKVVVLGASSAGLLAALAFKRYFPNLEVELLYTKKQPPIGVGESTTAWVPQFLHDHLKISRNEFYKAVWPVWKLGIRFEWGNPNISHFNYTFDRQFAYDSSELTHSPSTYCMHDMQNASRFSILMNRKHAPFWTNADGTISIVSEGFGYHLGIRELQNFLSAILSKLNVNIRELEVLGADRDRDGNITQLLCENDIRVPADLFVDCSGFSSKLLKGVMQEEFVPYGDRLFCDAAIVGHWERESPIFPYTTVTTMNSGWRWRIDLRDRVSFGYVYSSQFCDEEKAAQELRDRTPGLHPDLRHIQFVSGRYRRFWVNNVIAIGNASGFVEPLESTGQHMIAETIWRVMLALTDSQLQPSPKLVETTNHYVGSLWDEICDFLALHFKFNHFSSTPFWQHCQTKTDLGMAQKIVDLYSEIGACRAIAHLVPQSSLFEVDGYLTLLCGQQLPVRHLASLPAPEHQEWHRFRQALNDEIQDSFTPNQAFDILERSWGIQTRSPIQSIR
ncbi:MAG: tryptophan 7-halogenase, partial [Cyanobacteria bacterium J06639_1]